ncbi:type II secretion system F family protein [Microbacterium radiodurans]|uniref:Type II secretion system F family protein n=1 Tax=Microbacterium radiodurans TaxID=661398 RepID=A0A5J5ITK2_9MICO|nr:type II secretion system F family protein [Microbacterium radiodurans]KAA9086973.1 type II secretion system F family protein [Microbacterium radiodurans]
MILGWGGLLAAGVLLTLSPWLWPPAQRAPRERAPGWTERTWQLAGYAHAPVGRLAVLCVGAAAVAAAVAWTLTALPVVALVSAFAGGVAPVAWLRDRARRLRRARRALWPDVCDLLISAVRAGMPLAEAIASLAQAGPPALRSAFAGFARDIAVSGHFDSSALRLKAMLADPVADRIIESLRMARQVGGTELVPVLQTLSSSVRAEVALRAEVEARQSWIRGAAVLGLVAPWVILALLASRPEGARAYGSGEGIVLVVGGAVISVVAYRLMLRIARISEPRRWTT